MITAWLKKYGIGVDCSGFITQTLDYSTTKINKKDPKIGNENFIFGRYQPLSEGDNNEN